LALSGILALIWGRNNPDKPNPRLPGGPRLRCRCVEHMSGRAAGPAPDAEGTPWVMQAFSQTIDRKLTYGTLKEPGFEAEARRRVEVPRGGA